MMLPKLYLHLSPNFPCDRAGEIIELDPNLKGGDKEDSYWLLGKLSYCDIQLKPPKDREKSYHYSALSRIQCTLKYDIKLNAFAVLEGGIYADEKDTSPGAYSKVKPSANGNWLNNEKLVINDWATLNLGDRLHFGNDKKILIRGSLYETQNDAVWDEEYWKCGPERKTTCDPPVDESKLIQHSKANASPWQLANRIFDYLIAPSKTRSESFMKIMIASSGIAIAISSEARELIAHLVKIIFGLD